MEKFSSACYLFAVVLFFVGHARQKTCCAKDTGYSRPNVLFLVIDDLRATLGCYDDEFVISPNIDQLASRSVKFNHAYVQQAICAPSRTSFLTSRRPDTTRLYDFKSYWRESAGNFTTLPQYFKENGYYTASVGKVFHPGKSSGGSDDYPYSWSQEPYHPPTIKYKKSKVCHGDWDDKLHNNLICPVNVGDQPGGSLPDIQSTQYAVEFLKNVSKGHIKEPFFLAVGLHKPHIPLKYPAEYLKLYPLSKMQMASDPHLPPGMPKVAWNVWLDVTRREDIHRLNVSFPYGPIPDKYQILIRQSYFAATTYIDHLIGKLLHTLDAEGLASNTIVTFHGDHGWALGEHQEWAKYSNFEVVTRVPLMVYVPGVTYYPASDSQTFPYIDALDLVQLQQYYKNDRHSGSNSNALVELVDLFPSIVDIVGLNPIPTCPMHSNKIDLCTEGHSFWPLIRNLFAKSGNYSSTWHKKAAFSQYPRPSYYPQKNSFYTLLEDIKIMGYSMRTEAYRYTEWVEFNHTTFSGNWNHVYARELYLHDTDPMEDINRAYEHEYQQLVQDASHLLHLGWLGSHLHSSDNN